MLAVWLEEGKLTLRDDVDRPLPPVGEVLVRVLMAGICNTDLELVRGYYPFVGIPGHEFVGLVEHGPEELRGKRVVGEINIGCHECAKCRDGQVTHCEQRSVLGIAGRNGTFAEYLSLPIGNLHRVPDEVETRVAVFTEPLAAALRIQDQIEVGPDTRVMVLGDGKLGQLIAQTLALTGCQLTAVGRHASKLQLLARRGITTADIEQIADRTFDVAVDCTGRPEGFDLARRALCPRGTLVLKSTYSGRLTVDASALVVDELTLVGSRCGPFEPALRLLAEGTIEVESLIDARYPLEQALAAFEHARRRGVLKVLLEVDSGPR